LKTWSHYCFKIYSKDWTQTGHKDTTEETGKLEFLLYSTPSYLSLSPTAGNIVHIIQYSDFNLSINIEV
jgi:hypothetical protein